MDIMQSLVRIHNRIIQINVSGDSSLLMADSIRELRQLLQELENDAKAEQMKTATVEKASDA
jgi:CMP-2-keto-3-deoxyoctulosonic acid synthetase